MTTRRDSEHNEERKIADAIARSYYDHLGPKGDSNPIAKRTLVRAIERGATQAIENRIDQFLSIFPCRRCRSTKP